MCPYPIYLVKNDLYVPCGKCGACLRRSINDYSSRLQYEMRTADWGAYWLTLTYEDDPTQLFIDNYSSEYNPFKHQLQKYFKRLRKDGFRFSYFALGDYGDTFGRPHYHVIYFAKSRFDEERAHELWVSGDQTFGRGFICVEPLTVGRIAYTVRYGFLAKLDWNVGSPYSYDMEPGDPRPKPFFLMSRRPAIGANYLTDAKKRFHRSNAFWYYPDGPYKKAFPRYWKNKIFPGKIENLLHTEVYARISAEGKERVITEFIKQDPLTAESKWIERLRSNADVYLEGLRKQKRLKNKLL